MGTDGSIRKNVASIYGSLAHIGAIDSLTHVCDEELFDDAREVVNVLRLPFLLISSVNVLAHALSVAGHSNSIGLTCSSTEPSALPQC